MFFKQISRDRLQNRALIEDHNRLLGAQDQLRCKMLRSLCSFCGRETNCGDVDYEVKKLMVENTRLMWEIEPYSNFLCDPIQEQFIPSEPLPSSSSSNPVRNATPQLDLGCGTTSTKKEISKFLHLADTAMKELIALGKMDCPFWNIDLRSKEISLVYENYRGVFNNRIKPPGCVVEASRDTGLVLMTSSTLVKILMDTVITFSEIIQNISEDLIIYNFWFFF